MSKNAHITGRRLACGYDDRTVFDGLDFDFVAGERALVKGESGSGKSTFLYALCGVIPGVIDGTVDGELRTDGGRPLLALQNPDSALIAPTVRDEINYSLSRRDGKRASQPDIDRLLDILDLGKLANRPPSALSMGERQRAVIASILALEPKTLLMDEPISQLDANGVESFKALLDSIATKERIVVIASHSGEALGMSFDKTIRLGSNGYKSNGDEIPLATPGEKILDAKDLSLTGPMGNVVLASASVELRRGEVVKFIGPNGAGKSSMLKALAGIWKTDGGVIERGDGARIGYLPQNPTMILFSATVAEEIAYSMGDCADEERVREIARSLGVEHLLDRSPHGLSLGEKQRVALASVLAAKPNVLLLDEPTAFQDKRNADAALKAIYTAAIEGAAVALTDHREARLTNHCHRRIHFNGGETAEESKP